MKVASARRGQIAVLVAFALAAIAMLALMNVDVFLAARTRWRVQNAGDAAALAAARHQGDTLNRIGALNIKHIAAALANDTNECLRIVEIQRRVALLDPVDAVAAADRAAVANGIPRSKDNHFADILRLHAKLVRDSRASVEDGGPEIYPEPYPGAWNDYAAKIEAVCAGELAVGVDNIAFFGANRGHVLLEPSFYSAVDSRNWCWFRLHCPHDNLLETYENHKSWPPLPEASCGEALQNSEVFSIGVAARKCSLLSLVSSATLLNALQRYGMDVSADAKKIEKCGLLADPEQEWFFFTSKWRPWFSGPYLVGSGRPRLFPLAGDIKGEYNLVGADAAVRCSLACDRASSSDCSYVWTAAAKPFGCLETSDGNKVPANAAASFVLPCFTDVRLVPYDSVGGGCKGTVDHDWIVHVQAHLPDYVADGSTRSGCKYCRSLRVWENAAFRRTGARWLKYHGDKCTYETAGGYGGSGGSSCGH